MVVEAPAVPPVVTPALPAVADVLIALPVALEALRVAALVVMVDIHITATVLVMVILAAVAVAVAAQV